VGGYLQEQQPEVEAVASGAIASDYQRLRVEQVQSVSRTGPWQHLKCTECILTACRRVVDMYTSWCLG
jgi:hypothetical protein